MPIPVNDPIEPTEIEAAVAELRNEAQARMGRVPVGRLLPGPVLLPTSYSSRMIYSTGPTDSALPSSPLPGSPEFRRREALTPYGSRFTNAPSENELTSSIIKGRVAEGLLGLRHSL